LAAQALGFSPARISQGYDSRTAIKNVQGELSGKRSELIQQYFSNVMNQSSNEGVEQDIANFNRSNPMNTITGVRGPAKTEITITQRAGIGAEP